MSPLLTQDLQMKTLLPRREARGRNKVVKNRDRWLVILSFIANHKLLDLDNLWKWSRTVRAFVQFFLNSSFSLFFYLCRQRCAWLKLMRIYVVKWGISNRIFICTNKKWVKKSEEIKRWSFRSHFQNELFWGWKYNG